MIKLIVTDLDGTLLNDNHEVPDRFWTIAQRLFNKGIKLAIATGRPNFSIVQKFQPIVNELYAISDNGSLILHGQTELMSKAIPRHELEALILAARSMENAWPILCGRDQWYLEDSDDALVQSVLPFHSNFKIVDDLTKVEEPILKMTVCDLVGAEQNSYPHYKPFEGRLKVAMGGAKWLDVTRTDANKGEAVQMLQSIQGVTPDETLVFGDFMNDYEMMKTATYSYAMKNANPLLFEVARFITEKDNNEEGILDVIEELCLTES